MTPGAPPRHPRPPQLKKGKKHRQFSWIESWTDLLDDETGQSKGMTLTLSDRFYEGILMDGGLLARSSLFLDHRRARTLALPRRPQARGRGRGGGLCHPPADLVREIGGRRHLPAVQVRDAELIRRNELPGFDLGLELTAGEPVLRMTRRELIDSQKRPAKQGRAGQRHPATAPAAVPSPLPLFRERALTDDTIASVRRDFPGWDIYAIKADFDAWIDSREGRDPRDYQAAFYGFARQFHKRAGR